jgi:hypothetical protein
MGEREESMRGIRKLFLMGEREESVRGGEVTASVQGVVRRPMVLAVGSNLKVPDFSYSLILPFFSKLLLQLWVIH